MKIIFLVSDHKNFLWSQKSFFAFFQENFDFFDFWTFFLSIFENPKHFSNKKKRVSLRPSFLAILFGHYYTICHCIYGVIINGTGLPFC